MTLFWPKVVVDIGAKDRDPVDVPFLNQKDMKLIAYFCNYECLMNGNVTDSEKAQSEFESGWNKYD